LLPNIQRLFRPQLVDGIAAKTNMQTCNALRSSCFSRNRVRIACLVSTGIVDSSNNASSSSSVVGYLQAHDKYLTTINTLLDVLDEKLGDRRAQYS
jgi:hypothetical protein